MADVKTDRSRNYEDESAAIKRIGEMKDPAQIEEFTRRETRPVVKTVADARRKHLEKSAAKKAGKTAATGEAGEQPLDNTTPPLDGAKAEERKAEAKQNQPAKKSVPPIDPPPAVDVKKKIAQMLIANFAKAVHTKIDSIWNAYNEAIAFNDDDRKFKYAVGARCCITGDDPNTYSIDVKLGWSVKETIEISGMVKSNEDLPEGMDLVDMAEAESAKVAMLGVGVNLTIPPAPIDEAWKAIQLADRSAEELKTLVDHPDSTADEAKAAREELGLRKQAELGEAPAPKIAGKGSAGPKMQGALGTA